jgi:hypothetical protein
MSKAIDLSTAGIHLGYGIETTAETKPTVFIDLPNPKSIPNTNPEAGTYDVTSLNDTEWKRYIEGLKDVGGTLSVTFGMSQAFLDLWEDVCDQYEDSRDDNKRMWIEFYHPRLTKGFFFTCMPTRMGWAASDVDSVWDTSISVTPTGEIGWSAAIELTEKPDKD